MKKINKKAEISGLMMTVIVAVALIMGTWGIITAFKDTGDDNQCLADATPTYNATIDLCVNESQVGNPTNATATFVYTLSATERSLIGVATLFVILGVIYMVLAKAGLINKK